jgi:hypothetical protein
MIYGTIYETNSDVAAIYILYSFVIDLSHPFVTKYTTLAYK